MNPSGVVSNLTRLDLDPVTKLFTCPDVRRFLGGPLNLSDARLRADDLVSGASGGNVWAIRDPDSATLEAVGLVWLSPYRNGIDLEISYVLHSEHRGKGLAYQACLEVLAIAFHTMKAKRVVAETQSVNTRSIALLERLGMRLESRLERFGAEQSVYVLDPGGIGSTPS